MTAWRTPAKLGEVVNAALSAGRSFLVSHGEDTGGCSYVSVTVKWDQHELRLTWHTRTGTYRLFSSMASTPGRGWHDVTATKALELIASPPDGS